MVICPCGDVVDFVSVKHFTTMDVDDMETCTAQSIMVALTISFEGEHLLSRALESTDCIARRKDACQALLRNAMDG